MGWSNDARRQLTLPEGAEGTDPRIVIGPDVPPELQTIPGDGRHVIAAILWYFNSLSYHWYGLARDPFGSLSVVRGISDALNGTFLIDSYSYAPGASTWEIGSTLPGVADTALNINGAALRLGDPGGANPNATPWVIDGRSQGRGLICAAPVAIAASAPVTVETVYLTMPAATFRDQRAYELRYRTHVTGSATPMGCAVRARRTDAAGVAVGEAVARIVNAGGFHETSHIFKVVNASGADVTRTMVLTLTPINQPVGATVNATNAANRLGEFEAWDVGIAADFPGCPQI